MEEDRGITHPTNLSKSPITHPPQTCRTAKALYSGSSICRTLRMLLSIDSMRCAKAYGWGSSRYGGKAWPLLRQDESRERTEVIWFEVPWASVTRRRKSEDHWVGEAEVLLLWRERVCEA